jgi:putative ABC transport system permease protein
MKGHPPKWPLKFLRWFCREDYLDEIEGDLVEMFQRRYEQSPAKAKRQFTFSVIRYFRPEFIKSFKSINHSNSIAMFRNYLKTGWRNLARHKMYSAISIGGFALGIAACLFIALFIKHETAYDKQYPGKERIYRVVGAFKGKDEVSRNSYTSPPLARTLKKEFPEIETAGRLLSGELTGTKGKITRADKKQDFFEDNILFADQELLEILRPYFVHGNIANALKEPNTIAISKSKADKIFAGENPLGKTLILNDDHSNPYKIGGVFSDLTASHLELDIVVSMTGRELWPGEQTAWGTNIYHTYIKVRPGTDVDKLAQSMTRVIVKIHYFSAWSKSGIPNAKELASNVNLELQPVSEIYLHSKYIHDGLTHGDIQLVWMFGIIAGFIFLIACINFVNLTTARSANRAKEIALRKVVGSFRRHLVTQFLTESVLFSFLAFTVAISLTILLLPYFNDLFETSLEFPWKVWWLIPGAALTIIVVGIVAGIYPSLYLSGFVPARILKGNLSKGSGNSIMRSILVVFQFSTSIILIIGTVIVYRQLNLILSKDVGFGKDQVMLVQGANMIKDQLPAFKTELLKLPGVNNVTVSEYLPVTGTKRNGNSFWKKGKQGIDNPVGGQMWFADHDYIQTMGMEIKKGRDFNSKIAGDSQSVVINETMAKAFQLGDPIGQEITNGYGTWRIIGVVKDFNFEPLTKNIVPLCFAIGGSTSLVAIKASTTNMAQVIAAVENTWKQFSTGDTFRYGFLNESYAKMYENIRRMGRIFTGFAFLAIVIASLGLFALSTFMLQQRNKEISVRLVLGASVISIFRLLVSNFLKLVLISFLIAVPIAWYMMQSWLQDYVYRVNIGWDVFIITGICSMLTALFTIGYQTLRAALINPVKNLRSQ